jgi:hypothetical protein
MTSEKGERKRGKGFPVSPRRHDSQSDRKSQNSPTEQVGRNLGD